MSVRVGQVRLYEDRGRFIKYIVLRYSKGKAGSFAPTTLCLVLDTDMGGKIYAGSQMEVYWDAFLFKSSREVEL